MSRRRHSEETSITICGRRPVLEVLTRAPKRVLSLSLLKGLKLSSEAHAAVRRWSGEPKHLDRREFDELAPDQNHQGMLALLRGKEPIDFEELLGRLVRKDCKRPLIVLDQITDPQNFGAVLRLADASAASAVLITKRNSAPLNATVRRASVGASEFVDVSVVGNLQQAFMKLKEAGYWILGSHLDDSSQSLYQVDLPEKIAVVFGSEGKGLRELTKRECDVLFKIPMHGEIQSLNVSQAASITMFELLRKGSEALGEQ